MIHRRLLAASLIALFAIAPAFAYWQSRSQQSVSAGGLSFVRDLGSTTNTTNNNTIVLTLANTVNIGDTILVAVTNGSLRTILGIVDSGLNIYASASTTGATSPAAHIWKSTITAQLVSTNTITVTLSGNSNTKVINAIQLTGTATSSTSGNGTGSDASPTCTNGGSASSGAIAYGVVIINSSSGTPFTQPGGWPAALYDAALSGVSSTINKLSPTSGTITYNPSASTSAAWGCAVMAIW